MNKLFVFDLDDTLLYNKHNYSQPILQSVQLILDALGHKAPTVAALVALENTIDMRRIKEIDPTTDTPYLYNRRRFPGSLVATYDQVCFDADVPAKQDVRDQLRTIGELAFAPEQYHQNIHPSAKRLLWLLDEHHRDQLVLCTKGDREIQQDKLSVLEQVPILHHFSQVRIVDQKDSDVFLEIKNLYPGHSAYSVGNMYRGDILPALNVGYRGIYIPDEHWESHGDKEKALQEINPATVMVLDSLGQLIHRYGELI